MCWPGTKRAQAAACVPLHCPGNTAFILCTTSKAVYTPRIITIDASIFENGAAGVVVMHIQYIVL